MVLVNESFKVIDLRSIRYILAPYHKLFHSVGILMNKLII